MATLDELQAEAARRGLTAPAQPDYRAIAAAELARRETASVGPIPEGATLIGTFRDNGRIYRRPDGTLGAVSAGMATSDPAIIDGLMNGNDFAMRDAWQNEIDQQRLQQNPVASRANEVVRGTPFIGSYADDAVGLFSPEAAQNMRASTDAMQRQRPGETAALNATGAILTSLPIAIAAAPSIVAAAPASTLGRAGLGLVAGATTGGVEGTVYGFGEGQTLQQRARNALINGTTGAVMGGAIGLVAPYAANALGALVTKLRGTDVGTIMSELNIGRPAAIMVRDALAGGDQQAAEAALRRAGADAMLSDAGQPGRALLDAAAQSGGPAGATVRDTVGQRVDRASEQIMQAFNDILGAPKGQQELITDIRTATAGSRNAAYERAYRTPINYAAPTGQALQSLFKRIPESAWRRAQQLMDLNGESSAQRLIEVTDNGVRLSRLPDVRQLDYVKRALADVAAEADGQGKLGGTTDLGRAIGGIEKSLRELLRRSVPAYGAALDTAADAITRRNGVDLGYSLLTQNVRREDVARALYRAPASVKQSVREGVRGAIDEAMGNVQRIMSDPNQDARESIAALRTLGSSNNQTKLRILLGQQDADRLLSELDQAATGFELRAAIADNSRTNIRTGIQANARALANDGIVRTIAAGEPVNATKRLIQAMTGETPEARKLREMGMYDEIASALTGIRGVQAERALKIINSAINRQQAITKPQAEVIASVLITANLAGAGASPEIAAAVGVLPDRRAMPQRP